MANGFAVRPPAWFWIVAVASLLWAIAGCFAFATQVSMSDAQLAQLPAAQRDIWRMTPIWITGAYAVAVWVSLVGSLSLLLRRPLARTCFLVSLVAVIVQFGWTFLATPILKTVGPAGAIPFPLFIIAVAALLVLFSGLATRRGWLR